MNVNQLALFSAACLAGGALVSCDNGADPGLLEKISLLEAELRVRDERISTLQDEVKTAGETSHATEEKPVAPDLSAANSSYLAAVEKLRSQLAGSLSGWNVERPSVYPVEGPDAEWPIRSKVSIPVSGKAGRSEIVIPLAADASGTWKEPEIGEIIAKFKAGAAVRAATATTASAQPQQPAKPAQTTQQRPADVMGAGRTVDVSWGDAPSNPPQQTTPPPRPQQPAQAAQPQRPATPQKVMPTDRDVIIKFD